MHALLCLAFHMASGVQTLVFMIGQQAFYQLSQLSSGNLTFELCPVSGFARWTKKGGVFPSSILLLSAWYAVRLSRPLLHSSLPSFPTHCIFNLSCGVTFHLARNNFLPPFILPLSLPHPQLLLSLLSFWAPRCLNLSDLHFINDSFSQIWTLNGVVDSSPFLVSFALNTDLVAREINQWVRALVETWELEFHSLALISKTNKNLPKQNKTKLAWLHVSLGAGGNKNREMLGACWPANIGKTWNFRSVRDSF